MQFTEKELCKAVILNAADNVRNLSYNASSPRFACYGNNNQKPVTLWKLASEGGEEQQTVVKGWSLDEIKAGRTESGWSGDKDFGEAGKAFKFNKVGSFTVSYTAEKAEKVTLQLKIAVKQSNNGKTQFWRQIEGEAEGGVEKTRITFNGTAVTPGAEPDFTKSVASKVDDNGIISVPEWYSIIELDLVAGENTIKVEYLAGGYSYYIGVAQLVK